MKKLTGNGLWESSRMMLFEHRDAILNKQAVRHKKEHPLLDEQQIMMIAERLSEAYQAHSPVQLRIYDPYEELEVTGLITHVDPLRGRIRVDGGSWIDLEDILDLDTEAG